MSRKHPRERKPKDDIRWKAHELDHQLYLRYLDLLLKFNVFFYAITGGIVSFFVTRSNPQQVRWALLLPILMGTAFGILFAVGIWGSWRLDDDMREDSEHFGLGSTTDARLLVWFLWISVVALAAVVFTLGVLFRSPGIVSTT